MRFEGGGGKACLLPVMPVYAGIHGFGMADGVRTIAGFERPWIPAFAGMTNEGNDRSLLRHSREGGNPEPLPVRLKRDLRVWIPAFAGMTA